MESKYYFGHDEYLKTHPEITGEIFEAMEDTLELSDAQMFSTIMNLLV